MRKIKQLFCPHKSIDICGGGFWEGENHTTFMCLKCYKQFYLNGMDLNTYQESDTGDK